MRSTRGAGNSEGEKPTEYGNKKQTGKGLYFFALARGYKQLKYFGEVYLFTAFTPPLDSLNLELINIYIYIYNISGYYVL